MKKWDLFISHASEDKDEFVRPLVNRLNKAGFHVWFDEQTLRVGQGLRRSIERGLADSLYGVVVLSKNFFAKEWPQRELDALTSLEIAEEGQILPIWLNVDPSDIRRESPLLVDKIAIRASGDFDEVVAQINAAIAPNRLHTNDAIRDVIARYREANRYQRRYLYAHATARLFAVVGFLQELSRTEYPHEVIDDDAAFDAFDQPIVRRARRDYDIPPLVYIGDDVSLEKRVVKEIRQSLKAWIWGQLTPDVAHRLYVLLDEVYDLDYLYLMFGIPHYSVAGEQHELLRESIIDIGSRRLADA